MKDFKEDGEDSHNDHKFYESILRSASVIRHTPRHAVLCPFPIPIADAES